MGRIVLLIAGLFLVTVPLALLWGASSTGEGMLAGAGFRDVNYTPKDIFIIFLAMFITGYVFVVGTLLQNLVESFASTLTGGHNVSRDDVIAGRQEGWGFGPKVILGGFTYLLIAVLYGTFLQWFVVPDSQGLSRFTDLEFVKHVLGWPYWLCAALNLYGIPASRF